MALYEDTRTTPSVPRAVSICLPQLLSSVRFRVSERNEGCIAKGVIDDGDRTPHHQVL
jgi:hypothetical protein